MDKEDNMVSIVMPTYNRGYVIKNAIQSVIDQTYKNWELIIVDDGSTDETEDVVAQFRDSRVSYQKYVGNKGANHARNIGINLSQGKLIAFIDSDNIWKVDKLKKQVAVMKTVLADVGVVYCAFERINNEERVYIPDRGMSLSAKEEDILSTLFCDNTIDLNTALVKKQCFDSVGGFDESFPRFQDWEMFFRIILKGRYKVRFIDEAVSENYIQKDSISSSAEKYIQAMLMFIQKYENDFIENDKMGNLVHAILCWPCDTIPIEKRIEQISDVLRNRNEVMQDVWTKVFALEECSKNKFKTYYTLLERWLKIKQRGKGLEGYFKANQYASIAIYGMGNLGHRLFDELSDSDVEVLYVVDKTYVSHNETVRVIRPDDDLEDVDAIVITAISEYQNIVGSLTGKTTADIVSIEDVILQVANGGV